MSWSTQFPRHLQSQLLIVLGVPQRGRGLAVVAEHLRRLYAVLVADLGEHVGGAGWGAIPSQAGPAGWACRSPRR